MKSRWLLHFVLAGLALTGLVAPNADAQPSPGAPPAPSGQPGLPAALPEPGAAEIADRVQAFYDKTGVFKAGFEQRYCIKAYDKCKDSRGEVIFKKPGKMSWRYTSNGNRIVSDGQIVKIYDEENKRYYEQKMTESQYPAALSFLTGGAKLKQEFKLRKLDAKQLQFEGGYVLEGLPVKASPAYKSVLLYVDGRSNQVRRILLIDAQSNRNRFTFVEPVVNPKVEETEFQFKPPKGTQVVKP